METNSLTKDEVDALLTNIGNVLEDIYGVQPGDDTSSYQLPVFTAYRKLQSYRNATK